MGKKSKRSGKPKKQTAESGLPIDGDTMFSDAKGVYDRTVEARQTDLLRKIPQVGRFLLEGERILLVTTCLSPFQLWELFLSSAFDMTLKNSLLLFTDMRVIHVPAGRDYKWRDSIAAVSYDDCADIKLTVGGLYVKYGGGASETFRSVSYTERAKLRGLLKTLKIGGGRAASGNGRVHHCPRCAGGLKRGVFACPNCGLKFRQRREAVMRALAIPGGGYFHTGHPVVGAVYILIEAAILALLLVSALALEGPARSAAFIFMGVLVFIKVQAAYQAGKMADEFIPVDKGISPLRGASGRGDVKEA